MPTTIVERTTVNLIEKTFENVKVRIEMLEGEPWFSADDIMDALGVKYKRQARFDVPVHQKRSLLSYGERSIFINEGALYRIILQSRKPNAVKFQNWVSLDAVLALWQAEHLIST